MKTKTNIAVKIVLAVMCVLSMLAFAFTVQPAKADGAMIMMKDGGSIRYIAPAGIRFSAYASEDLFTDEQLDSNVEVGMLLVQEGKGTASDLTLDTQNTFVKKVSSNDAGFVWAIRDNDVDGFKRFNVVVTNIPEEAYGTTLYVNAYVKIGSNVTYATNDQARSIARVATQVLAKDIVENRLAGEEEQILIDYMPAGYNNRPTATTSTIQPHFDGENIIWGAIDGAIGYYVALDGEIKHTTETTIALSEFENTSGLVNIIGYGDGVNKSISREWKCYVGAVPGGIANGVTNGMSAATNCPPASESNMNVLTEVVQDGLKITVHDDAWRSAKFGFTLNEGLNVTSHTGMVVKFKMISSDYTAPKFGLIRGGLNYNLSNHSIVVANNNEWQYLYLFNSNLSTLYSAGEKRIDFMFYETGGTTSLIRAMEFVIGEIKYFDAVKLSAPTNLAVTSEGVVTWDAVADATGYDVEVNGSIVASVTNTTYTLTNLSQLATIKVYATSTNVESYLKSDAGTTVFDPTPVDASVIFNFNTEADLDNFVAGSSVVPSAQPTYDGNFRTAPSLGTTIAGVDGNAVEFAALLTVYTKGQSAGIKIHTFFLNLDDPLNLTDNDSITIRFACKSVSGDSADNKLYFTVLGAKSKTAGYTDDVSTLDDVAYVQLEQKNTWYTLTVTKAQLIALGYADGDTQLAFGVQRTDGQQHWGQIAGFFAIDYIKYGN